jgi:2C-methyl-D-erythritol 2,4-cyclodiphosphate synthase
MILGHDFKYHIPEMDRLLGAAADLGIHFPHDNEYITFADGRKFLLQQVTRKTEGGDWIMLQMATYTITKREKTE